MDLPANEIYAGVLYQLGALSAIAQAEGGRIAHVKPHGALYNQAARDAKIAEAIVSAVHDFDPSVAVFALANSGLVTAARASGPDCRRRSIRRPRLSRRRLARAAQGAGRAARRRRRGAGRARSRWCASAACRQSTGNGYRSTRRPSACTATARTRWRSHDASAARCRTPASKFTRPAPRASDPHADPREPDRAIQRLPSPERPALRGVCQVQDALQCRVDQQIAAAAADAGVVEAMRPSRAVTARRRGVPPAGPR